MAGRLRDFYVVACHENPDRRFMCSLMIRVTARSRRGKPLSATCPIHGEIPRDFIAATMAGIERGWREMVHAS